MKIQEKRGKKSAPCTNNANSGDKEHDVVNLSTAKPPFSKSSASRPRVCFKKENKNALRAHSHTRIASVHARIHKNSKHKSVRAGSHIHTHTHTPRTHTHTHTLTRTETHTNIFFFHRRPPAKKKKSFTHLASQGSQPRIQTARF